MNAQTHAGTDPRDPAAWIVASLWEGEQVHRFVSLKEPKALPASRKGRSAWVVTPLYSASAGSSGSEIERDKALQVLAEFAKTAPGRLPQSIQDAVAVAAELRGPAPTPTEEKG